VTRAWLHLGGLFPTATPVRVLSRGPKRARVRLVHRLRWNRKWLAAGSTRYVPSDALGAYPNRNALVGIGRGVFIRQDSRAGRISLLTHTTHSGLTDLVVRGRVSKARAAGKLGAR
jgi:hypothetical protein